MEDEIDLRPYIETLLRGWKWVVGTAVAFAIIALLITFITPPIYEATAMIAITDSRDVIQLDSRIREVDEEQPARAYPQLAKSDDLLQRVLVELDPAYELETIFDLENMLEVNSGNDIRLLLLTVTADDQVKASQIANVWAEQFVPWANEIYGTQSSAEVPLFERQLTETQSMLETAENALIEFEARNQSVTISNTLAFHIQTQTTYLVAQRESQAILQDVQRLRDKLESQLASGDVSSADQMTSMLLQLKALNLVESELLGFPLTIQIDEGSRLIGESGADQIAFLDDLSRMLEAKLVEINENLADLEPQILVLQRQLQELKTESAKLARNYELAEETYLALAYQLEEERMAAQDVTSYVRLASKAAIPEEPANQARMLIVVFGGMFGSVLAIVVLLSREWWRPRQNSAS